MESQTVENYEVCVYNTLTKMKSDYHYCTNDNLGYTVAVLTHRVYFKAFDQVIVKLL